MNFTSAHEVIDHLYSLPHLHPKSDLSYIKRVLEQLGNPQDKVKTIHVTGTNGKGSTCYYLSSLLKKAGQKTGLFVSPYVREFNERIQLNNQDIPDQDLIKTANQVEQAILSLQKQDPSFSLVTFEYETALAFLYFAQQHCDYAVIEVGIGGKHDKTNVITPQVSVITTIGLDHEKIIGPTIQDIAKEKSGVIKKNRPVVLGNVPNSVLPILKNKAKNEQAPVFLLGQDFQIEIKNQLQYSAFGYHLTFTLRPKVECYDIGIALTAFFLLKIRLDNRLIEDAINETTIPGRYQVLQQNPLIILDGAHNIQAMTNLLTFIHHVQIKKNGKVKVLITMMKDKDLTQVFSLFSEEDEVCLTTIPYPRAAKLSDFPIAVQKKYHYEENYITAFNALKRSLSENDILVVTGSFYLVSAILDLKE